MKNKIYIFMGFLLAALIAFRVYVISTESNRKVFNIAREESVFGVLVDKLEIHEKNDILLEPLFVKNNRALVSGIRVHKFGVGQNIADGKIASISTKVDLDSGMYVIRTRNVTDGHHFAESRYNGFFIPLSIIKDDTVMVIENGLAVKREIKIENQDFEKALVSKGLKEGDIVILSAAEEGEKIR